VSASLNFKSKTELIYDMLLADILKGKILPGERLNVDALAREYGVSKIPLRETLQKLEIQGLVVQVPHVGAHVAPLSFREMKGIFLLRESIEGLAARLAADTITDEELLILGQINAEMKADEARNKLENMSPLNQKFHNTIAKATRYVTVQEAVQTVIRKVLLYRVGVKRVMTNWRSVIKEHEVILRALHRHDGEAAEQAAQEHIRNQLQVELKAQIDHTLFVDEPFSEVV
jgi:DNA-binding GntR family transcriptional regulator